MQEAKEKENLDTPGGEELGKRLGGIHGLPWFAFLDANGEEIINSDRVTEGGKVAGNIGHPDKPEEVDWFMVMVHRAAPQMTADESATLEHWLRNQKKAAASSQH